MRHEKTKRRDAEAAKLRVRGHTYQAIADQLGFASPGAAHDAVSRSLAESVRLPFEQQRELALNQLDQLACKAWEVVQARHCVVSAGKVMAEGGTPLPDPRPVLEALSVLVRIEERKARLLGLDAPRKTAVGVITEEVVDAEIGRLQREIEARTTGG
jgi:hypothetical protein